MKTAVFQFKCRMCGQVFDGGITGEAHAHKFLIELMVKGSSNCNNSIPLFPTAIHPHAGGNGAGLADCIGYQVTEKY